MEQEQRGSGLLPPVIPEEHLAPLGQRLDVGGGQVRRQDQALRYVAHGAEAIDRLNARLAQADEIEAVVVELEADLLGHLHEGLVDRALEPRRHREVTDRPARRADQVVVVLGEGLGELVAGEVLARDDPVDQAGLLEHREIAVRRAHGQAFAALQDLVDGERVTGGAQDLQQRTTSGSESLPKRSKPRRHDLIHVGALRSTRHIHSSSVQARRIDDSRPGETSKRDPALRTILFERNYFGTHILGNAAKAETHRICHETSEDALIWNVLSRLLSGEMLSALLSTLTGLSLKNEPELYLWGLQVRLHDSSGPLLFPALKSAREIFERGISKF